MTETTALKATFPIEWRELNADNRIVGGIAIPWAPETSYVAGTPGGERFMPGSLNRSVSAKGTRLKLFRSHDHTTAIGRPVKIDARHPDGLYTEWQIAKTPAGDAALTEITEGMLDSFSIGFRAIKSRRGEDGAREIQEAEIHEVSILPLGAYDSARVLEVRAPSLRAADLTAWLAAHPVPDVNRTPLPDLYQYRRR
jgi:HK97 family phage prohead protease